MREYKENETSSLEEQIAEFQSSDPDLRKESLLECEAHNGEKFDQLKENLPRTMNPKPFRFVPLKISLRTHKVTKESASLIQEVPLKYLKQMTELFYKNAFLDETLDKFLRSHEDPHGARFAKWIHQKLSGSKVWDQDRKNRDLTPVTVAGGRNAVVHDRSSAHAAAWYSPKRPKKDVGRHFQLGECRVWMRLHFWAMREAGLIELSPSFADYYVRFIGHFVRIYEGKAPMFARDSLRWSENPTNIDKYLKNGRKMQDVLGLSLRKAIAQIPENEANDMVWPYNRRQHYSSSNESW